MTDNVTLPGTGLAIASDDIGGVQYQRVKPAWGVDGVAGDVTATNPLPTSVNASIFRFSTNNTSSAELAASATFTGVIETALDQPSISLLLTSDQPITLTIRQFIDVTGTYAVPNIVYYIPANQGLSASFALNGNYVQVLAQNTGTSTTTTFELNTAYGSLPSSDGTGRLPVSKADCVQLLRTTISAAGISSAIDTNGFGAVVCQISGTWQGSCYFEASNDGLIWDTVLTFSRDNLSLQDLITSGGLFTIRPSGRYLHLVVTNLTGTMAINAQGRAAEGVAASDLLSLAMDRQNNTPLNVALMNYPANLAGSMLADPSVGLFYGVGSAVGTFLDIDTSSYQSGTFTIYGSSNGTLLVEFMDVAGQWNTAPFTLLNSGASTATYSYGALAGTALVLSTGQLGLAGARRLRFRLSAYTEPVCKVSVQLSAIPIPGMVIAVTPQQGVNLVNSVVEGTSAGSTNPLAVGGWQQTTLPAVVTNGAMKFRMNTTGSLIVSKHSVPELTWVYAAPASGLVNTTTAVTIKAAVVSQRGNISSIQIQHEPLGAATEFAIRDGAAGTVLWRIKIPLTTPEGPMQFTFDPPLRQAAVNTLLEIVTLTASVTGAVYFNAQGFMSN